MIVGWIQLLGGLGLLIFGGDFIVRSAVKIATYLKVSPMVVGLTIVSFGTSLPELVVSVNAALSGHPDIAIGNIVGSNIANLALVLGLTTTIRPIRVVRNNIVFDWPVMLLATLVLVAFSIDNQVVRWEGLVLFALLMAYNFWVMRTGRLTSEVDLNTTLPRFTEVLRSVVILVVSLAALIIGADILIDGAVTIARGWGIEERVIAVTIIAFGTSAPELATSLLALRNNESGLGIGNLIGSNIFNILGILGVTSLITDVRVSSELFDFDFYWLMLIPLLAFPFLIFNQKIGRILGLTLLAAYFSYLYFVF